MKKLASLLTINGLVSTCAYSLLQIVTIVS